MEIVSAKQRGSSGAGMMAGEGEKQLELEKRRITEREAKLRTELADIERKQTRIVKDPTLKNYATIALIGYTNVGKTALLNHLAGESLISQNLLFQTLNTIARRFRLPSGQTAVLLDTVGFISDLPHELVESFKATLQGVQAADILLHIRDISHPYTDVQRQTVFNVLEEIGYPQDEYMHKYIEAWNKVDLIEEPLDIQEIDSSPYPIIPISALHGINMSKLLELLDDMSYKVMGKRKYLLKFPLREYGARVEWLRTNINNDSLSYSIEHSEKEPMVRMEVMMDDVTLKRYHNMTTESDTIELVAIKKPGSG